MDDNLNIDNIVQNNNLNLTQKISSSLNQLQDKFLQSKFGEVVNTAIDAGITSIAPNFLEDQIIDVKNTLFEDGFKAAINEAIDSSISLGKSAIGIFTGNFENINQIEQAVKKGGMLDSISSIIDTAIDFAKDKNILNKDFAKVITAGKKAIIKNVSDDLKNELSSQVSSIEKLNDYCEKWNAAYKAQDLEAMNKNFNKIEKQLENIVPLEALINKAREIENLQNLITNNGGNFDISNEKLELVKVL
ncbi:MAG: hypothetical protein J6J60_01355 [Clostridia bacterium]|nr:hypothetical protein [Clostridia bacterium]